MSIEFSGDSIIRAFPFDAQLIGNIYQIIVGGLVLVAIVAFDIRIPNNINLSLPFWMILLILIAAFIHGALFNSFLNSLNEVIPFLFFLIFIAFAAQKQPISILQIHSFLVIFICVIFLKLIFYTILTYFYYGSFSWKVLLKQSPVMLLPLSIFFMKISRGLMIRVDYFLLLIVLIVIIFSMARMLMLATIFLFVVHFFNKNILRGIPIIIIIALGFWLYTLLIQESLINIGDFIYGGDVYEDGLSYRVDQFEIIMDRIVTSPLLGVGFGYFTPGYLTYEDLAKPYLLELDFFNFISKIGLILFFVYVCAYIWIYKLISLILDNNVQMIYKSLFWALIGLVIYSLGQTAHQSYVYWVVFAFLYGNVVSELRSNVDL